MAIPRQTYFKNFCEPAQTVEKSINEWLEAHPVAIEKMTSSSFENQNGAQIVEVSMIFRLVDSASFP
jgi:hypothetical protein